MSAIRLLVSVVLVAMTAVAAGAVGNSPVAPGAPPEIPYTVGAWHGAEAGALDADTEEAVAADLVLNRTYADPDGHEAGLYVAYYNQQRPGVSIHSPLHCLPGTGWDVVSNDIIGMDPGGATSARSLVRRLVAQKAAARVLVIYWYSINGQIIAGEMASRLQLLSNRLRLGRNDAALVRIAVPVTSTDAAAEARAVEFARALDPHLR
jgi:EpsI family protein